MSVRRAAVLAAVCILTACPALAQSRSQSDMETDWAHFIPPTDGSFSTWGDTPPEVGLVKRVFALAFPEECGWALGSSIDGVADPEVHDIIYRESYDLKTDPDRLARLYRFNCNIGAYNEQHVYLLWDGSSGLHPVMFAEPRIDATYENDDSDGPLKSMTIDGMVAGRTLTNSWYDPEARTIFTHSCWRGLCDASAQAAYKFASGTFFLRTYDADPTYDDKVNPFRVYDATAPQPIELVPVAESDMRVNPAWAQDD